MTTFLIILGLWLVLGPLFFNVWARINWLELYIQSMPVWKIAVALFIGGPASWVMFFLS